MDRVGGEIPARARHLTPARLSGVIFWICVFLGGFVINEPAPYDLLLAGVVVVWLILGLKLHREFAPMLVLMILFVAGGLLSITQSSIDSPQVYMYYAVTSFLVATSVLYAAAIVDDPDRLRILKNAYVAAALVTGFAGVAGYFHLLPGSEIFTLYGRAKGAFQDPNVFGPFLVLPTVLLVREVLTEPIRKAPVRLAIIGILLIAVLLAFSRAAWGLTAFSIAAVGMMVFINEQDPRRRMRLIAIAAVGVFLVAMLLLFILSTKSASTLFAERAHLVNSYDGGRLGRFARYLLGFELVSQKPLGIGPYDFAMIFPEDPHNTYLKAFIAYGWLGGICYFVLYFWTLLRLFPVAFQKRPWQPYAQCVLAVMLGHTILQGIIDTDHWRHLYLLFGVAWGVIALEKKTSRRLRRSARLSAGARNAAPSHGDRHKPTGEAKPHARNAF